MTSPQVGEPVDPQPVVDETPVEQVIGRSDQHEILQEDLPPEILLGCREIIITVTSNNQDLYRV